MSTTVFCEQCGARLETDARFCAKCGSEQQPAEEFAPVASATAEEPMATPVSTPPPAGTRSAFQLPRPATTLPVISGRPLELWLVIAAFVIPGAWLAFDVIKALPDSIKYMGGNYLGFRLGLALVLIVLLVGLIAVAMLIIGWRLYRRDRVGRGLAFAFAGTLVIAVLFSDNRTTAETLAAIFSVVAIGILAFSPSVREIFSRAASPDAEPTSVIVGRTGIAMFSAVAAMVALIYLLEANISGKYVAAAIVAAAAGVAASFGSRRLKHADRAARLYLTVGGAIAAILLIALGQSATGVLYPIGVIVTTLAALWLPNDAREFFGDEPLRLSLTPQP